MTGSKPLVSIGMPTYNGTRFIDEALDSLLVQDFGDFELVISDNASTDGTPEWCIEYARRDSRIRYYRSETNIGMARNFNRVFELSRGEYFMWAADHDLWDKSFVRQCFDVLEAEPEVVLCCPQTMLIDVNGNPLGVMPDRIDTRSLGTVERFQKIVRELVKCNMVYGLVRSEVMRKTRLFPTNVIGADQVFLAELSLLGAFAQIPEPLFLRRQNREPETDEARIKRTLATFEPGSTYPQLAMPHWMWLWKHVHMVLEAQVDPLLKPRLLWVFLHCFPMRISWTLRIEILRLIATPIHNRFGFDLIGFLAVVRGASRDVARKVGWHGR